MKNQNNLKSLLLACMLLLSGCATSIKPITVNSATYVSFTSQDILTAIDVASDIASIFPDLSKYHNFPQTTVDSIGITHKTGVIAAAIDSKVTIEYRTYYLSRSGPDRTEAVTSLLFELTILPDQGVPGRFSIVASALNEKPGYLLFHIPLKPFVPSEKIAADLANVVSLLPEKLDSLVVARSERNAKFRRAENDRIVAEKHEKNIEFLKKKQILENAVKFRNALNVGVETNCGPVIDIKSDMIKVYFPVQNYGNEQWIHREDIFPPTVSCRFINGKYQIP